MTTREGETPNFETMLARLLSATRSDARTGKDSDEHNALLDAVLRYERAQREAAALVVEAFFDLGPDTRTFAMCIAELRAALSRPAAGEPEQEQNRSGKTGNVQLENH